MRIDFINLFHEANNVVSDMSFYELQVYMISNAKWGMWSMKEFTHEEDASMTEER